MTKTYTTEEIVRRLKAGERVTCITNDSLNFTKGNNYKYSHAIGDMIHFYVNSIPIGIDINKFTDYFMFQSDRNNINFSTKYTEKEILERLTNGETITAINPCTFVNSKVDQFNVGKTYIPYGDKGRFMFVEYFTVISNVDVNHKVFIKDLCDYFMFTTDYEAMKSEEKGMEAAYQTLNTEKELPFVNLGSTTLINQPEPPIPEWLQRERVRFWGNRYGIYLDRFSRYSARLDNCFSLADRDLEQFDKRFLTQKD